MFDDSGVDGGDGAEEAEREYVRVDYGGEPIVHFPIPNCSIGLPGSPFLLCPNPRLSTTHPKSSHV